MRRPGSCLTRCDEAGAAASQRPRRASEAEAQPRASEARRPRSEAARPLLVIDGDSFAHRSYHALPKTILRRGGKPAGAIVGFANYAAAASTSAEQPRAVLVALGHARSADLSARGSFPPIRAAASSTTRWSSSSTRCRNSSRPAASPMPRRAGYEADDFLAAAVAAEEKRGGTALVASGDRDTFQLASERTTILYPVRAGEMARIGPAEVRERYGVEPQQVPDFIALRGDPPTSCPARPGWRHRRGQPAAQIRHAGRCAQGGPVFGARRKAAAVPLDRHDGRARRRCRRCAIRRRPGTRRPRWRRGGDSNQLAERLEKL